MVHGGYRPGAGRPKNSAVRAGKRDKRSKKNSVAEIVKLEARAANMTPLEYMLAVMNDSTVDVNRRDRMAIAAATFVHAKAEAPKGKRESLQEAAAEALTNRSGEWGDDLNPIAVN